MSQRHDFIHEYYWIFNDKTNMDWSFVFSTEHPITDPRYNASGKDYLKKYANKMKGLKFFMPGKLEFLSL